jgi:hypothetical protein
LVKLHPAVRPEWISEFTQGSTAKPLFFYFRRYFVLTARNVGFLSLNCILPLAAFWVKPRSPLIVSSLPWVGIGEMSAAENRQMGDRAFAQRSSGQISPDAFIVALFCKFL